MKKQLAFTVDFMPTTVYVTLEEGQDPNDVTEEQIAEALLLQDHKFEIRNFNQENFE